MPRGSRVWGLVMDDYDSVSYFMGRAEQEEEAARVAASPLAARIHLSLAERYRAKAYGLDEEQTFKQAHD